MYASSLQQAVYQDFEQAAREIIMWGRVKRETLVRLGRVRSNASFVFDEELYLYLAEFCACAVRAYIEYQDMYDEEGFAVPSPRRGEACNKFHAILRYFIEQIAGGVAQAKFARVPGLIS